VRESAPATVQIDDLMAFAKAAAVDIEEEE
jgi:hypothetical protein